ncbi:MAG: site-2 protease family protein [Nitrososphaerales archaeon]
MLNILGFDIPTLIALLVILLFGFPVHELSHAWVAYRLGDNTAKYQGRLTFNPLAHLDLLGSLMLLVTQAIGWAKPVPVNPYHLRYGPRVGHAIVSAAGPVSNLLMAAVVAALWRLGVFHNTSYLVIRIVEIWVGVNVALFLFNLIPLAPRDGSAVLSGIIGARAAEILRPIQAYGPFILMGLLLLGWVSPQLNIVGRYLGQGVTALSRLLLGI